MALLAGPQEPFELLELVPTTATLAVVLVVLFGLRRWLERRQEASQGHRFRDQVWMLSLTVLGAIAVILSLPVEQQTRTDLLNFLGLLLSASIALASTTILGNVLAGLMMRSLRNFKVGDFVKCEGVFGRVTERGLFHTEVQTEDRDLTTLPNLFLATRPMTVMRSSGTIVSATVSLGYDEPHGRVRTLLLEAAEEVDLGDPFVRITELGDFTIVYRVGGLLTEVKELLSRRTKLRAAMLDVLHGAGIEIASPTLMSTRAFAPTDRFAPQRVARTAPTTEGSGETSVDSLAFDKADAAECVANVREELEALASEREELEKRLKSKSDEAVLAALRDELDRLALRERRLQQLLETRESELPE